jgi:hypothetical protein
MPTVFEQGPDNVIVWINSGGAVDAGEVFQVKHLNVAQPPVIFEVRESGDVVIYGGIRRRGTLTVHNTTSGDGIICSFKRGGNEMLALEYQAANGAILAGAGGLDYDLVFRSANDLALITTMAIVNPAGGGDYVNVSDGQFCASTSAAITMWWVANEPAGAEVDAMLRVGNPLGVRGMVRIRADTGAGKPGLLVMEDQDGVEWFLWVDTAGLLHIRDTDPLADDTLPTEVKTQT